ncbi:AIPR family protein [Novosphingobium guangzhouense]|uniref:Abortive phage infection protein C-terminal domain-containing protein n=1 Tax=Novosphingobium guangzhouense TaxID=1850347 RepID=A0A2K2FUR3_9SPHN|nr:AIPR family protein [Novosphingobium guangzhouense]PNU02535.1 hypothetical protein A8V01_09150 [Novosphingobium guangzhouense]
MTQLRVKQLTKHLADRYEPHLDLSDIKPSDPQRMDKVLSRCLAAHAIFMRTDCSPEEAARSVWDGSDDNGIDAVFADHSDDRLIIVQAKFIKAGTGEPDADEVGTFADGVRDIIEENTENFAARLHSKLVDAANVILTPGCTIEIVLVSTGKSELARHATVKLDRILRDLNGAPDQEPLAAKQVLGLEEVYSSFLSSNISGRITVDATITDWARIAHPYAAYFGVIDGYQLKTWWLGHGKRLVAKNIRHSLGDTDVNAGIASTATFEPENFWYFNNGITLVADEAIRAPAAAASRAAGNFQFKGASIVNGAQTVSTLAGVPSDEELGKVRVPIRVILLKDAPLGFGTEVTRTNNLQNRVEGRDFAAQDPEQMRLQKEMSVEGVEYQISRSEDVVKSPHACELLEATTALACASGDAALAVQVKTGIGRFFNDLSRAPYKAVFNATLSGARTFNAILVLREIDKWIDKTRATIGKRSGFPWGVLIHGNRVLAAGVFQRIGGTVLNQPIEDFRAVLPSLDVAIRCQEVHIAMVEILEEDFPGKFLAILFKSPVSSKQVFDQSLAKLAATPVAV